MPLPTPDQLQQALAAGNITQDTYNQAMGMIAAQTPIGGDATLPSGVGDQSSPPPAAQPPAPVASMPQPTASVQPPAQPAAPSPPPPAYDPSVANALAAQGKYSGPGVTSPNPGAAAPAVQAQVAAAPGGVPAAGTAGINPARLQPVTAQAPTAAAGTEGQFSPEQLAALSGGTRPVGISKADRTYLDTTKQLASETKDSIDSALAQSGQAADDFHLQTQILANDTKTASDKSQAELEDNQLRRQAIAVDAKAANTRISNRLDSMIAQGIDPNRWWNNQDTGSRISTGLAVLFGGLGGHHGNDNAGLDTVHKAIQQDIEAQKFNMNKNIEVLSKESDVQGKGFEQQLTAINAERDSILTAYNIVDKSVNTRAAMYGDDAKMQQTAADIKTKLETQRNDMLLKLASQQYSLEKRGEQPGANPLMAQLQRAVQIKELLSKLDPNSPEAQKAQAELDKIRAETAKDNAAAGNTGGGIANLPEPKSTNWSPVSRNIQGTDTHQDAQAIDRWNALVMARMHSKLGVRSPEAMEKVGSAYMIKPGDSQSTIDTKYRNAQRDLGGTSTAGVNEENLQEAN